MVHIPCPGFQMGWSCPKCDGHGPHSFLCNLQQHALVIQKLWILEEFLQSPIWTQRDSLRIQMDSEASLNEFFQDFFKDSMRISRRIPRIQGLRGF